jgi:hypothetical protein
MRPPTATPLKVVFSDELPDRANVDLTFEVQPNLSKTPAVKPTESRMPLKLMWTASPSTRMGVSSAAIALGSLGPGLAKRPPLWKSIIRAA